MARYGPNRTYRVNCIRWDMTPDAYKFEQSDETQTSMAPYFMNTYKVKISKLKQPLFEIR